MTARGPSLGGGSEEVRADDPEALDYEPVTALVPYLRAIRSHGVLVLAIAAASVLACALFLSQRSSTYESTAQILVTPLVPGDQSFVGLPIVRTAQGDPTRTVETAAGVIESPQVAAEVAETIGTIDGDQVESAVEVSVQEGSNLIDIAAEAGDPDLATTIASEYANSALEVRRLELQPLVEEEIAQARRQLDSITDKQGTAADALRARLRALATVRDKSDPTLSIAQLPASPGLSQARPGWLLLILAGLGGLAIGAGSAILGRMLAGYVIEDEEALLAKLPLPILARVRGRVGWRPSRSDRASTGGPREVFRLLRTQLQLRGEIRSGRPAIGPGPQGIVAVLDARPGDGATRSILELARVITHDGGQVIVVEQMTDGNAGLSAKLGVDLQVPGGPGHRDTAPFEVPNQPGLRVVSAHSHSGRWKGAGIREVVRDSRRSADCVIVDAGAASTVGDGLSVLHDADHIIVVIRFGHTRASDLQLVAELLEYTSAAERAGVIVLGSHENRIDSVSFERRPLGSRRVRTAGARSGR